jgi:hypothetical protein
LGVIGGGIVLAVLWGALWCWLLPDALLGTPFGVMFTSGWLMFWGYRLAAQIFVYGPWVPSNYRWAHYLLIGVFSLKTACFACATQSAWLAFR